MKLCVTYRFKKKKSLKNRRKKKSPAKELKLCCVPDLTPTTEASRQWDYIFNY